MEDATFIRSRLLRSFERAGARDGLEQRAALLTCFVIVGGGPTRVDCAGAIKELAVDVIPRDFRVGGHAPRRVLLIEAGPRLLPAFGADSSARALAQLTTLGVEVRLGGAGDAGAARRGGSRQRLHQELQRHLGRGVHALRRSSRASGPRPAPAGCVAVAPDLLAARAPQGVRDRGCREL